MFDLSSILSPPLLVDPVCDCTNTSSLVIEMHSNIIKLAVVDQLKKKLIIYMRYSENGY